MLKIDQSLAKRAMRAMVKMLPYDDRSFVFSQLARTHFGYSTYSMPLKTAEIREISRTLTSEYKFVQARWNPAVLYKKFAEYSAFVEFRNRDRIVYIEVVMVNDNDAILHAMEVVRTRLKRTEKVDLIPNLEDVINSRVLPLSIDPNLVRSVVKKAQRDSL